MMLGDLLAQASRAAAVLDPALRERLERDGAGPAEAFAQRAVRDFERHAREEDWATLVSRVRRAEDPAAACLDEMIRWRLAMPSIRTAPRSPP
jgi:hypothetical protein